MPSESVNVFVSYSHADALLVSPVVKLLRVNKSLVFQDIDGIQPGKKWRDEIAKALAESHLVVVFWCTHARASNEVSKEWQVAIQLKKDLLPLLLDATPLPPELAEFQWIDFRATVGPNHFSINLVLDEVTVDPATPMKARWSLRPFLLTAVVAVFGIAAVVGWLYAFGLRSLLVVLGIGFSVCLIWLGRVLMRPIFSLGPPPGPVEQHPGGIERHIASEVEAEILRRTSLRREEET